MPCASYSPMYIDLISDIPHLLPFQSERIFCALYSHLGHLGPYIAYYHLAVSIATFYSYHVMVYFIHLSHTATLRLELNALLAFLQENTASRNYNEHCNLFYLWYRGFFTHTSVLDRPPHDIDLNTFLSQAPWVSSWVSPESQPIPPRFDWI